VNESDIFPLQASSVFPIEDRVCVVSDSEPQFGAPYLPHFLSDLFHIFRDGRPPESLPVPTKTSPKSTSSFPQ